MYSSTEAYRALCSRVTLQNKSEGCFFDLVEKFGSQIHFDEFAACSSDVERITFCASQFWNSIGVELIFRGKDAQEGTRFRLEGNTAFEKGDLQNALLLYSKSAIRIPPGDDLGSVLANRSALLYRMKEWNLAIEDAKLAMVYNYSEERRSTLYLRMTSAHLHLKNFKLAKVTAGLAEHFASKHGQTDETFKQKLDKVKIQIQVGSEEIKPECTKEASESSQILKNEIFPSASSKFGVKTTELEGRFAVAVDNIDVGEKVVTETPFASCLLPDRYGSHCHHCLQRLRVSIPCDSCAYVAFCSTLCRDTSKKYHQFECKILLLLVGSGMSILPLLAFRIITQQSPENLLAVWDNLSLESDQISKDSTGVYDDKAYRTVFNLIGHENQRDPIDFFQRTIMALFLLKSLRLMGYFKINIFKNPEPTQEELEIGSLILRNLQVLQFNAYEIVESQLPLQTSCSKLKLIPIGLGIYPTAAFLNHSCAPNVTRYFNGTKLHIVTTQPIGKNQAIEDNYGPLFTKVLKQDRQRVLGGRYWFECNCTACLGDWKTLKEIEASAQNQDVSPILRNALGLLEKGDNINAKTILLNILRNYSRSNSQTDGQSQRDFTTAEEALRICLVAMCE